MHMNGYNIPPLKTKLIKNSESATEYTVNLENSRIKNIYYATTQEYFFKYLTTYFGSSDHFSL